MKIFYIAACGALMCLTACATTGKLDPKIVTKEVNVEIVKSCIPADFPEPAAAYADDNMAAVTDPVERITRRAAANQQRRARLAVVEPIVKICR